MAAKRTGAKKSAPKKAKAAGPVKRSGTKAMTGGTATATKAATRRKTPLKRAARRQD